MTCRELLKIENPELVSDVYTGGCSGCPDEYKYAERPSFCSSQLVETDENCEKCWNREVEIQNDNVNHPSHYTQGGIECYKAIKASMTPEAYKGYLKGNILKYVWRYEKKGSKIENLRKAEWYLKELIKEVENK